MGKTSQIQWTDATWNVAVGCRKVDADCKFCYMYRDSLNGTRYDPKEIRKTKTVFDMPLKLKVPSKVFTCSLTDFFLPELDGFRNEAWDIIRKCPQHTFQILTKRPENIADRLPHDWGDGWKNVWLGTSVGSQDSIGRIARLVNVHAPNSTFFLSLEPLHGPIDLYKAIMTVRGIEFNVMPAIDWIIVGGESGHDTGKYRYRPCQLKWIEDIVSFCKREYIAVFVKQLGTHLSKELKLSDRHGGDIEEFPEHLRVREFPFFATAGL